MPVTIANEPTLGVPQRPLRRSASDAVLGGVCAGIAVRLGLRARTVRLLFAVLALAGGVGLVLYMLTWVTLRRSGEAQSIAQRIRGRGRLGFAIPLLNVALVVMVIGVLAISHAGIGVFAWTALVSCVAAVIVATGSSSDEQQRLHAVLRATPGLGATTIRGRRAVFYRLVPGVALVVVGLHVVDHVGGVWGAAVPALVGALALIAGVLVLLAPWWLETVRDLTLERRERVRIEERNAMATHLHDSVLQTLTLIERAAGNEADVVRLARAQERALRQWLFNPGAHAGDGPTSFATLASQIEADVEDAYGVRVELVVVGDCTVDERVTALLGAAREAALNAARWSGASSISLFAEVEPAQVSMFVRDRGCGFDPDGVAPDHRGIALSIKERMLQVGGRSTIRTEIGHGTEVELVVARNAS